MDKKIAIYARKSKATETGKSMENQITKCSQYAFAKLNAEEGDLQIFQDYGLSGFYADRPAYQDMVREILAGNISAVLCYKIDRISRKTLDLLNFIELLKQKNVAFISCTDDIDTQSKTGKIMLSLLASIAEFERDIITERITDNLYELAKEGRWLGGVTPMGYKSVPSYTYQNGKKTVSHHLEIIAEEAAVIRQIYTAFLATRSLQETAKQLQEKNLHTRKKQPYTPKAVKNILENPVYAIADPTLYQYLKKQNIPLYTEKSLFNGKNGLLAYNKTRQTKEQDRTKQGVYKKQHHKRDASCWIVTVGSHQGIISGEQWIAAQHILQENQNKYRRPKQTSSALLSEKVRCPICKSPTYVRIYSNRYTSEGDLKYVYACKAKYHNHTACPHSPNIPGNDLDKIIWLKLADACCRPTKSYAEAIKHRLQKEQEEINLQQQESKLEQLKKQMNHLENAITRQVENLRAAPKNISSLLLADLNKMQQEKESLAAKIQQHLQTAETLSVQKSVCLQQAKETLFRYLFSPEILWQNIHREKNCILSRLTQNFIHHIEITPDAKKITVFLQRENASLA